MNIKILVPTALAVLFAGSATHAAEPSPVDNGPWVGVIEDIQDVDTYAKQLAEEQRNSKGFTARAVIGGSVACCGLEQPSRNAGKWF